MLVVHDLRREPESLGAVVARTAARPPDALDAVRRILADVEARGDAALLEYTQRFDGAYLTPETLRVPLEELAEAWEATDAELRDALTRAAARVRAYHRVEAEPHRYTADGVVVAEREIPVERAGVYVPGGRADYPSTVLMTVIPAQVAGVDEVVLCVPPAADGSLPATTAAAAHLLGVGEVYRVGGAQAIAAMAFGTATIRPVDMIAGPGNVYVALAKAEVAHRVGVESLAGPSELVVIADEGAPSSSVAVDLMAQAEHGPGGFVLLATWSDRLAGEVEGALARLVAASPRRGEIEATLADGGRLALCRDAAHAVEVANAAAPEHLQLMVSDPEDLLPGVRNAGAVFCGYDTPVTLGDYVAGPSHVLPTAGTARFASALRVADFSKSVHVVTADRAGLAAIGPIARTIAEAEGLQAHADAVTVRLGDRPDDRLAEGS